MGAARARTSQMDRSLLQISTEKETGWGLYKIGADVHVCPENDLRHHYVNCNCWCSPEEIEPGIWMHNSMDRREEYEQDRKMS